MVGQYTQKSDVVEDPNTHAKETVDDSTLELDKPDIGASVVLPLRQVINSPEATAYFVMLMPTEIGQEIKVGTGKTFTMPMGDRHRIIWSSASRTPGPCCVTQKRSRKLRSET